MRTSINDNALEKIFCWKSYVIDQELKLKSDRWKNNILGKLTKEYWECNVDWRNKVDVSNPNYFKGFFPIVNYSFEGETSAPFFEKGFTYCVQPEGEYGADVRDIAEYCKEHGIRLILVTGVQYFGGRDVSSSIENWEYLRCLANEFDAEYYNLNMFLPEYVKYDEELFHNFHHINKHGAEKITKAFCEMLAEKQKGIEKPYFYDNYNDWIANYGR